MVDGFSSADPRLARGPQVAAKPKRRRSSRRSSQPSVIIKGGTVTINGQGFSVAPSLQAKFIQQKTGGSGSSAQAAIVKAQQLAQQEAQRLATAERLAASQRILALRKQSELIKRGAKENIRNLKNREGQRVKLTWVEKGKEKIFTVKNLDTGEFTVRQFKNGRRVSDTTSNRGVIGPSAQEIANKVNIKKSSDPNKLIVQFPNGQKGTINASGTVMVGARLAGNKYTFKDGVIIAVDGKTTYARDEFVTAPSVTKPEEREERKITKVSETGRNVEEFLKNKSKKWEQDISTTKGILRNANQSGELDKLRELQKLGNQRTTSQNAEYNKLKKQTARNYELGGELVGKIIGTSLINMGVGTKELLKALNENPKETLIALPPAIYAGVKQDFNRVMGGDPLEIASIPLEWYTFGKLAGVFSKTAKASVGIGRTLSPKYFTGFATKLAIPPTTLRRIAVKTATGRSAEKAIKNALKKSGVSKKVAKFNKNVKMQNQLVERKLTSIQRRSKAVKTKIKKKVKVKVEIAKKSIQYKQSLKQAKKLRIAAGKKGKTLHLTSPNYKQAIDNINVLSDAIARVKTYEFLKKFAEKGGSINKKQVDELLEVVKRQYRSRLESTSEYQILGRLSRQDRFLSVKLIKQGKIKSARIFFNKLVKKVQSIPAFKFINKNISSIKRGVKVRIKKIRKPITKVRKKVEKGVRTTREKIRIKKRRVVRKIKRKAEVRKQRKFIRQTIRYKMEKSRPVKGVTIEQLYRTQTITGMNKFIDRFFKELELRQKITVSTKTYSQMKNILKKRMRKAIKTGDKAELKNFGDAIKKLAADINKKPSRPDIKVVEKVAGVKKIRTIKDFEPSAPKGAYQEVKSGSTVLLQKVKTKQVQKVKVISVLKKKISLKPLMMQYGIKSLTATAIKNILKSKQAIGQLSNQAQLLKVLQDSAVDLKILHDVAQVPKTKITSAILSAVNSKTRVKQRLRTKQITKQKKKKAVRRIIKTKNTRTLSKKVMTYGFIIKKAGRQVKIKIPPMTLKDAWDVGSKKLDFDLQRTGKLIPVGMTNEVAIIPKSVKGYYGRNSKKFRRHRIKKGKKFTLERTIIEKRKYVGDTASEKRQLKAARRKKKATKKKPATKKKTKTIKRSKK